MTTKQEDDDLLSSILYLCGTLVGVAVLVLYIILERGRG